MSYKQDEILRFSKHLLNHGFTVFLSKTKDYGFFTNKEENRIVSFQYNLMGAIQVSGNYQGSRAHGTGWQMGCIDDNFPENKEFELMLCAGSPSWANPKPNYTTLKQYMEYYGDSSGFTKQELESSNVL